MVLAAAATEAAGTEEPAVATLVVAPLYGSAVEEGLAAGAEPAEPLVDSAAVLA
jgi:hypothetical protein